MSGSELGASSLSVWIVLFELGVWIGASQALCACERAAMVFHTCRSFEMT